MRALSIFSVGLCLAAACAIAAAQEIRVPATVTAGNDISIPTTGSGKATFYLVGPGTSRKTDVSLGQDILLRGQDLRHAGSYLATVCAATCQSGALYVTAAKPAILTFLVHPSRVPVSLGDAVSGVAFPFDQFHNLVRTPLTINFQLTAGGASVLSRSVPVRDGAAWFRATSGRSAGFLQVVASIGDLSTRRVVQQVASDPCNLRITGQPIPTGVLAQTEVIHDCTGNVVPDGTIVTFTASNKNGRDTVDAPVKQGVARAKLQASGPVTISAASGVVLGNELRLEARQ